MAWFSRITSGDVDLSPEEIRPDPEKLKGIDLGRTRESIGRGLTSARDRLSELEDENHRIHAEIANTRVAIAAFEAAEKVMSAGLDPIEAKKPAVAIVDTIRKPTSARS